MACFLLIPGAGGAAWYWHRVVPLLRAARHQAIAVELPGADEHAGLDAYADIVARAAPTSGQVVVVAHSMGAFTAPLVCARRRVDVLVFVNAMLPNPGETANAWWGNTGATAARERAARRHGYSAEFDLDTYFFHDVPEELRRESAAHEHNEAKIAFTTPCGFDAWPDVPSYALAGKDDRFFPEEFQAKVARERLQLDIQTIAGGHLAPLSQPQSVAERLIALVPPAGRASSRE